LQSKQNKQMAIVREKESKLIKKYNKIEKGRVLMYKTLSNFSEYLKENNNAKLSKAKSLFNSKKQDRENALKELELSINMNMKRHETNRSLTLQNENKILQQEKHNLHVSSVREKYQMLKKSEVFLIF
jgi:hypothetical protein